MKTLKIGIAPVAAMRARSLAIASGAYKPRPGEPKIWFPSIESLAKILSDRNRTLLTLIAGSGPQTLTQLAALSGRHKSNLSRTLKTMAGYGLVRIERRNGTVSPRVSYAGLALHLPVVARPKMPSRRRAA